MNTKTFEDELDAIRLEINENTGHDVGRTSCEYKRMQNKQDLPREKLNRKGAAALTDVELLQAVIGSGGKDNDYKQIAKNLNAVIQKTGADKLTIDDVKSIKGIGVAKATIVFAALEFWRRKFTKQTAPIIDTPEKAAEIGRAHV